MLLAPGRRLALATGLHHEPVDAAAVTLEADHHVAAPLKKAHRRLAKALHPDRIMRTLSANEKMKRQEQFLLLQAAYEFLSRSLKEKEASDLTCGNESASESGSQRQDVA